MESAHNCTPIGCIRSHRNLAPGFYPDDPRTSSLIRSFPEKYVPIGSGILEKTGT